MAEGGQILQIDEGQLGPAGLGRRGGRSHGRWGATGQRENAEDGRGAEQEVVASASVTFQNRSPPNLQGLEGAAHCTEEDTEAQACSGSGCCPGCFSGSPGDFC